MLIIAKPRSSSHAHSTGSGVKKLAGQTESDWRRLLSALRDGARGKKRTRHMRRWKISSSEAIEMAEVEMEEVLHLGSVTTTSRPPPIFFLNYRPARSICYRYNLGTAASYTWHGTEKKFPTYFFLTNSTNAIEKKENERDYAWTGKIITDRRSTTWTFPFHSFITWRDTWASLNKSSQEKREKSECPFPIADDSVDDGSITFHPLWQKSWSGNRWRQKWERGQLDRLDLNHRRRVFRLEPSKGNGPRDACQVPKVKVKDPCGTRLKSLNGRKHFGDY